MFRVALMRDQWSLDSPIDLGWLTFSIAVGAAALVPSMATVAMPTDRPPDDSGPVPLVLITISAVIPFALVVRTACAVVPASKASCTVVHPRVSLPP